MNVFCDAMETHMVRAVSGKLSLEESRRISLPGRDAAPWLPELQSRAEGQTAESPQRAVGTLDLHPTSKLKIILVP